MTLVARAGAAAAAAALTPTRADLDQADGDGRASGRLIAAAMSQQVLPPRSARVFGKGPLAELSPTGEPGFMLVSGRG